MPKKRVALVLSGGVSLGAYIAGALDELVHALTADGDFVIDVITGASAGATTGAIIAHGLLYRGGATALHDVWVKKVDMVELLAPHLPDDQPITLLSNARLNDVAAETLAWPNPNETPARSSLCDATLTVALPIANIEGLSYVSRIKMPAADREEAFIQDRHAEQETFLLDAAVKPDDPLWRRMQQVAIASAALPFVFPPVPLTRRADDPLQYIQKPSFEGEATFLYADGGTFNNLPIDLAWHYARENDGPGDERYVIMVDPSQDYIRPLDTRPATERPAYRSLLSYALTLLGAVFNESRSIQFDREVLLPAKLASGRAAGTQGALPGVDRAEVELLDNVALVLPQPTDPRLKGSRLLYSLSAFLDESFREYDFRRGAADAQRVAKGVLKIDYTVERPGGALFYTPDADPQFQPALNEYAALDTISSSRDPQRTVRAVFEDALKGRLHALINRVNPPGPDIFYSWFLEGKVLKDLEDVWG